MSRLIVNADDLGYTEGVNAAVFSLHARQAVSSATAMACGEALENALDALPALLGIGCHVVLVDGRASTPPGRVATLGKHGIFRSSLGVFAAAALAGRLSGSEIEAEASAQIRFLAARGLRLTHIDTHKHTHLFPAVLRPLLRAARACGVPAVRNPFEPQWARVATKGASLARRVEMRLLDGFHTAFRREVEAAGLRTTEGSLGVLATGVLDAERLDRLLHALSLHGKPEDTYELVCHPAIHDAALDRQRTRLKAERQREFQALAAVVPRWTGAGAPHRLISFAAL